MSGETNSWGQAYCQVVGCTNGARPWDVVIDLGEMEIGVHVCPRHERELTGKPPEVVPPASAVPPVVEP